MAENLRDLGNQVAAALQATPDFQALQKAFDEMKADAETYKLFQQFQQLQGTLQQKQMAGQKLTDDELKNAHDLADKVSKIESVKHLMETERGVNQILSDLNQTITQPIQNLYQG
ncbi:YlbF family regulator [Levilactobacillus spicheri]